MAAHSHFTAQLKQARGKSAERQNLLEYRLAILETQNRVFNSEPAADPEDARNFWKFATNEKWD